MAWTLASSSTTNLVTVTDPNGKQTLWSKTVAAPDVSDDVNFVLNDRNQPSVSIPYAATSYGTKAATITELVALFSKPSGGGGGGNVANGTVDDSLLVWSGGASSWVESTLMLLKNFGSNIYGFLTTLGDYSGLIGRSGNSTALTSIDTSNGNTSSFTATGGLSEMMSQVGGKSGTLKVEGQKPVYAEYTDWQDAAIPFFQETDQDLTTGITDMVIASNLTTDHDLYITSVTAYVISWVGVPNWNAVYEVTANGIQLGTASAVEPPLSANLTIQTAILRYDQPVTDLLKFSVTVTETGATSMILRTLVTGFYRPRV